MLIVVTVFAIWLGCELHQIRERDRLLRTTEFLRLFEYRPRNVAVQPNPALSLRRFIHVAAGPPPQTNIPFVWRLLGDKPVVDMDLFLPSDDYSAREARRIQSLFPECAVTIIGVDR
jgi:hypothetical protein